MNIGEAARRSGLPAKTIRNYEDMGLVKPARASNGYRDYAERDVQVLRFIQRSLSLGFPLDETRRLLAVFAPGARRDEAQRLARRRVREIDRKIEELQTLRRALAGLMDEAAPACPRGWPVLDEMPNEGARVARPAI
ncbi:MerR family transcriptional regulator [Aureimonas sp. SK2]|uniref:MerR family transcriptional regulator n=1 Tax=Aureimonas sp. SK2 TaxID=3015992 RepID=UPI0024450314|nr:MerR family transcriptional regulator [Aureimonas sp. SK2]